MNISLSICYKLWGNLFIFTINIPAKSNITWGLIFRGKIPARPMGAYFQRGLIFEGGLLFRVYSTSISLYLLSFGQINEKVLFFTCHKLKELFLCIEPHLEFLFICPRWPFFRKLSVRPVRITELCQVIDHHGLRHYPTNRVTYLSKMEFKWIS